MNKLEYGYNRDRAHIWFEEIEPTVYEIHTDDKHKYVLEYACINFDEVSDDAEDYDEITHYSDGRSKKILIDSFDPAGGPYMAVGSFQLEGKTLKRVQNKGKLLFKFE